MAKLTAAQRNKLPAKEFGEPAQGKYPMPDKEHAALAKSYATQELSKGNLSKAAHDHIVKMANSILGGNSGKK